MGRVRVVQYTEQLTLQNFSWAKAKPSSLMGNLTSHEPTMFCSLNSCSHSKSLERNVMRRRAAQTIAVAAYCEADAVLATLDDLGKLYTQQHCQPEKHSHQQS